MYSILLAWVPTLLLVTLIQGHAIPRDVSPTAAVQHWQSHHDCLAGYFSREGETTNDSGFRQYYVDWEQGVMEDEARKVQYDRIGAIELFNREKHGGFEMNCDVVSGCKNQRSCAQIVSQTISSNPEMPIEQALDEARKIYHVQDAMVTLLEKITDTQESFLAVRGYIDADLEMIVNDFMQPVDGKADMDCQLAIAITEAVIGIVSTGLQTWMPGTEAVKSAVVQAAKQTHALNSLSIAYGQLSALPSLAKNMAQQGLVRADTSSGSSADNELAFHVTPDTVNGECKESGAGRSNNRPDFTMIVRKNMGKVFHAYRVTMEELYRDIKMGPKLAPYIILGNWTREYDHGYGKKTTIEKEFAKAMSDHIASRISAGSPCYQVCQPQGAYVPDGKTYWEENGKVTQARYSPDGKMVCQPVCFSTISNNNRQLAFYGANNLEKHGLTMEGLLKNSYDHYLQYDGAFQPAPELGLGADRKFSFNNNGTTLSLPTCVSKFTKVGDFEKKITRQFPCQCGDWRSDELAAFLQMINLDLKSGKAPPAFSKEIFEDICPLQMAKAPPANRFLQQCQSGVGWPMKKKSGIPTLQIKLKNPVDSRCDMFYALSEGLTEKEGNDYLCGHFPLRDHIFNEEYPHTTVPPAQATKDRCKKYRRNRGPLSEQEVTNLLEKVNKNMTPEIQQDIQTRLDNYTGYKGIHEDKKAAAKDRKKEEKEIKDGHKQHMKDKKIAEKEMKKADREGNKGIKKQESANRKAEKQAEKDRKTAKTAGAEKIEEQETEAKTGVENVPIVDEDDSPIPVDEEIDKIDVEDLPPINEDESYTPLEEENEEKEPEYFSNQIPATEDELVL